MRALDLSSSDDRSKGHRVFESYSSSNQVGDDIALKPDDSATSYLDYYNRRIISLVQINPSIAQTEIAKELGLSQSSIALRLKKLSDIGLLKTNTGLAYEKLGLHIARVDVDVLNADLLLEWTKTCPLFMFGMRGIGTDSVSLFFVSEDLETMQSIVDRHIRKIESVSHVKFWPVTSWVAKGTTLVHLDLLVERKESPPCGLVPYCPNCPANPSYDGSLWCG